MQDPHSLTRDLTRAPCIGSTDSEPLDDQGSPRAHFRSHFSALGLGCLSRTRWEDVGILEESGDMGGTDIWPVTLSSAYQSLPESQQL